MHSSYPRSLFNELREGIAVSDNKGEISFTNDVWSALPSATRSMGERKLLEKIAGQYTCLDTNTLVSVINIEDTFIAVVHLEKEHLIIKDQILSSIISSMAEHKNIFEASTSAMGKLLKWRWVAVGRFDGSNEVETLAFWDKHSLIDTFTYNIIDTPCGEVIHKRTFIRINDVREKYPQDKLLNGLGVKVYAGYVYRNKYDEVLGHIFLMHDDPDVDWLLAEETLHMVSTLVGATLALTHSETEVKKQKNLAQTDSLTQLYNRFAFDVHLKDSIEDNRISLIVAMIDLDGMKHINDTLGHQGGDHLLQAFAEQIKDIGREGDHAYRFGGDEFAVIFLHSDDSQSELLFQRFQLAIEKVQAQGFKEVGASIGLASSKECKNDIQGIIKLADERMYKNKILNKKKSMNKK